MRGLSQHIPRQFDGPHPGWESGAALGFEAGRGAQGLQPLTREPRWRVGAYPPFVACLPPSSFYPPATYLPPSYLASSSMLPALRTLASAKLAWHRTAATTAPGALPTTHTRTVRGEVRQVVRRAKRLVSNGAKVTGDILLGMVYRAAQRLVGTPALWSSVVMTDTGVAELPAIHTNSVELGEKRDVTDRTIRTHLAELKRCGFISRYQYRGTNARYVVWINPNFVWEAPQQPLKAEKTSASETALLAGQRKNLPHTEILESLEAPKYDITDVEKLVIPTRATATEQNWNPLSGSAGPQPGCEPGTEGQKSGAGAAGAARRAKFYGEAQARGTGARMAAAKAQVEAFWSYAKATVYKKVVFNEEAERKAKNAIWAGVFYNFEQGEPAQWQQWLKPLLRRLELAADWVARNPGHWVPEPYAEVVAGRGYFDAENKKGFAGTEAWLRAEQAKVKEGGLQRALDEALTELAQRKALDAGAPRRYQASKRARRMSLTELHRFHHTKLRRMGGDEALVRFAARLHTEHILNLSL